MVPADAVIGLPDEASALEYFLTNKVSTVLYTKATIEGSRLGSLVSASWSQSHERLPYF